MIDENWYLQRDETIENIYVHMHTFDFNVSDWNDKK